MSDFLTLLAPAKINRFLHVCGRREDGYHNLQTAFQFLSVADKLTFELTLQSQSVIQLLPEFDGVAFEDNLIIRAARLLQQTPEYKQLKSKPGVNIHIDKKLPMGGGIGGGSSNAATTLWGLNKLWCLNIELSELKRLGLKLGADVPVFLFGKSAWAEGVGEKLQPIDLQESWLILAVPNCHVSTKEIFLNKSLTRDSKIKTIAAFLEQSSSGKAPQEFKNDCESLVRTLYSEVDEALNLLSQFGLAQMTGTGACVFVLLNSKQDALDAQAQLPEFLKTIVCKAVNHSPLYTE
ncbi:MAG: 4-(cytidine 5'-diphospho)-2-C-methyl-D-erythritol kinase [Sinobacterium sp.]|nr:4-(cytidine 5'-diphospho)-2-C-methyl-D-erythritol kinase [Sinobacterium sp.]